MQAVRKGVPDMKTITIKTIAPTFIHGHAESGGDLARAEWDDDSAVGPVYRCYRFDSSSPHRWQFSGKKVGIEEVVLWLRACGAVTFTVTASAEWDGVIGD